eukprot:TRINITY_DN7016_c0_g1_i1.p1 TRINITY_DN7016_c0_g1~~TRINITY_DN7016_c0_g1_i1.p1  ORF type:complete len:190 (+),score=7.36 TRINITY_DN7016_c0_g1_i1:654-1223(+)
MFPTTVPPHRTAQPQTLLANMRRSGLLWLRGAVWWHSCRKHVLCKRGVARRMFCSSLSKVGDGGGSELEQTKFWRDIQTMEQYQTEVIELSEKTPVVLYLHSNWGTCHLVTPIIHDLIRETKGKVQLIQCDIDVGMDVSERVFGQMSIPAVPAVVGYVLGGPVSFLHGCKPRDFFEDFMTELNAYSAIV